MNKEEILDLPGTNNPVLCSDGMMGMLVVYPAHGDMCGIQVPGEPEHRWIHHLDLVLVGEEALRQKDAPQVPPISFDFPQAIIREDWVERSGTVLK